MTTFKTFVTKACYNLKYLLQSNAKIKTICLLVLSTTILFNLWAAIAMDNAKVTGTLSYPPLPAALMERAIIYITLIDVSPLEDSSGSIISRVVIDNPLRSPIYFELKYNLSAIDRRHTYTVQAHIARRGKVILTHTSSYPVITRGNPYKVDIVLMANYLQKVPY